MNQELNLSSNLVDYFRDELPSYKECQAIECLKYIEQNFIALDDNRNLINSIISRIDNIYDSNKRNNLGEIFGYLLMQRSIIYKCNIEYNKEYEYALLTKDRIYFDPFISAKEANKIIKQHDIDVYNTNSFINPSPFQRLKNLPTSFYLESECIYDLNQIFEPFLRKENNIEIYDPYLPNKLASFHFIRLLENNKDKYFSLYFYKRDKFKNPSIYDEFLKKIDKFKEQGFLIKLNIEESTIHAERYIITDNFQISLPGGFDCLNYNGMPRIKSKLSERKEITIKKRDQ